jgi:hypothetical protein
MTRISAAHRPDMASGADRIVRVFRTAQSITDSRQLLPDKGASDRALRRLLGVCRRGPRYRRSRSLRLRLASHRSPGPWGRPEIF